MDRTEATLRKLFAALPAPGYDLGILSERGMYRLEAVSHAGILRMLPYLKYRNANGAHIDIRPTGESAYTLLDDLTTAILVLLDTQGYQPAAIVETSPGSFQAWLSHAQPLSKDLGTLAAKTLAEQFGADSSAADWRRFGRAPGFTNRKLQHRNTQGQYPFARLVSHPGQPFPAARPFRLHLDALQKKSRAGTHRRASELCFPASAHTRFGHTLALPHFAPLCRQDSRRGYGFQHSRLCSGLGRVRDRRRPRQALSFP